MKKLLKGFAMVITVVLVLGLLAGCGGSSNTSQSRDNTKKEDTESKAEVSKPAEPTVEKKVKIGLSLPTQQEERWVRDKDKIEAVGKELGAEVLTQIANMDAAKQASQVENLISQGIDILIIAPHDAKASAASVDKAHAAGIKVITYDRLIMGTDVDLYISFDNVSVGKLQGEYITNKVPKGNYVVLSGAPTDNNAKLFKQGAMEYIKPLVDKGDIKIVFENAVDDWKPDVAMKLMEQALTANNNKIDAVLAPNDGTAGGCIEAMAAQGLAGKIPITGQDAELAAAKRIVAGTQAMTVYKDTRALGETAVKAALKMVKGEDPGINSKVNNEKMDVPSLLLVPIAVDKDNLDKMLIDSGYLKKEDVYGK